MGGTPPGPGSASASPGGASGTAEGGQPAQTVSESFLTVNGSLKRILDHLEFSKRAVTAAGDKTIVDSLLPHALPLVKEHLPIDPGLLDTALTQVGKKHSFRAAGASLDQGDAT